MIKFLACKSVCLTAALLIFATHAPVASAQQAQRDMQKEAKLWEELAAISPKSVETFKRATEAMDKGDMKEAARLYNEVIQKAPNWDAVNRRLGISLVGSGRAADGIPLLRDAVEMKRSPQNLITLAQTLAYPSPDTQGSVKDKTEALALAKEADVKNTDLTDPTYPGLVAELALELNDIPGFRAGTNELVSRHQDLMVTHYFNAILQASDEKWAAARQEIERAGQMGLSADAVEDFLVGTGIRRRERAWLYAYIAGVVVLAWGLGLAALFVLGGVLSRHTLKNLESADPNELVGHEHDRLRSVYRKVINAAGAYYYVSIPVVILLVVGVTGVAIYALMMGSTVPIKLVAVLAIGAAVTVFQLIRSLFTRPKQEDPGRVLSEQEAPGLWALSREVAGTVGTRPVSEIRVTPGTEVAVYERGSFRERMQDRAERVLLIGVGALNGFHQNAFRAVLAHEYGHFMHRDTAGGDMALRVQADMMKFAVGMIRSGQNTVWNLGFHFLRLYHRIFTRISHGASRLQEALADRRAAYHFGPRAFEEGLSHVVRRQIEFEQLVDREVRAAAESRRALSNLYELQGAEGGDQQRSLEEEFQKALNRPTSDTDTHPSPADRFRLARRVAAKGETAAAGMVWDLFADREKLTREMSSAVQAQVMGIAK